MAHERPAVLVTGATGFLGEHAVLALRRRGYPVGMLARGLREVEPALRGISFHPMDLRRPRGLARLLRDYDAVIHLAGRTGPIHWKEPLNDLAFNAGATLNLLLAASEASVKRVVLASSSEVYGAPRYLPMDEKHPLEPSSPYGVAKLLGEQYARVFSSTGPLETVILRFFTLYGPPLSPENFKGVTAVFTRKASRGEPVTVYGNRRTARDFVYVEDAVRALLEALRLHRPRGETFNVATGQATPLHALATQLARRVGRTPRIRYGPADDSHPAVVGDPRKLRRTCGFRAEVPLEEGLRRTLAWFQGSPRGAG